VLTLSGFNRNFIAIPGLSLRSNPGLKLANAFSVLANAFGVLANAFSVLANASALISQRVRR